MNIDYQQLKQKWARPEETLDYIEDLSLMLLQKKEGLRVGTDAALLCGFVRPKREHRVVDLGSGSGVIGLLLHQRSRADVIGIEIQAAYAEMARRNVYMNGFDDAVCMRCMDLREAADHLGYGKFDHVVCNPPYYRMNAGPSSPDAYKRQACEEHTCTLEDVCRSAAALLKSGGRLAMILPCERAGEAIELMIAHKIQPKRALLVQPTAGKPPRRILIDGIRDARPGMHWLPTLCIRGEDGQLTQRMQAMNRGESI